MFQIRQCKMRNEEIFLLLVIVYSLSLIFSIGHLAIRMDYNWSIEHAIGHSSIRLNKLTTQGVFNGV